MSLGASRETWSFDCLRNGVTEPLILRRYTTTLAGAGRSGGMLLEARLFDVGPCTAGLPVPQILASGDADPEVLETGFLVMTRVDGETIARKILR